MTKAGATLAVKLSIANTGERAFPFGLGFHPFFPRTPTTALDLDVKSYWENDDTLLPIRRVALPANGERTSCRRGTPAASTMCSTIGAALRC
jgi:aldose 1-epimerase